jgi:hypothetical protein
VARAYLTTEIRRLRENQRLKHVQRKGRKGTQRKSKSDIEKEDSPGDPFATICYIGSGRSCGRKGNNDFYSRLRFAFLGVPLRTPQGGIEMNPLR